VTEAPAPPAAPPPARGSTKVIVSWATYDLANTVYYAIVVTAFLPPYFDKTYGGLGALGVTTAATLLVSGLVSPGMGARVDRTGRARPGLDLFTWLCVGATAVLCFVAPLGRWAALSCYAVSLFAYQAAITFYNALLPVVAPPGRRGFVSALGTGIGYGGVPLAVFLGLKAKDWTSPLTGDPLGVPGAFLVAALLMLVGTIPLWLHVKDDPSLVRGAAGGERVTLLDAVRRVAKDRILRLLLIANFVCADVANTLIQYATAYFEGFSGFTSQQSGYLLMALAVTALVGGLAIGRVADRTAPTRIYLGTCAALVPALVAAALFPGAAWSTAFLVVAGGVGVSAIWSVGRQLVLRHAPPDRCGETLGLYGVTVKVSIVGTAVFGLIRDAWGYRPAVLVEAATLAFGCSLVYVLHRRLVRLGRA
jgi:UMF1 family MFS transporter